MLTLYHAPRSRSTRILWLLEELGATYRVQYVDVARMGSSGGPDPANPHPDKKVPALDHDGMLVTESSAICLYLTDLHPESDVSPAVGDPRRGAYVTWLAYSAGVIEPVVVGEVAGVSDNEVFSRSFRGLPEMQRRIVGALESGPYLLGEAFSAADVLIGSLGQWGRQWLPPGDPVDAYLQRLNTRPAVARAMMKDAPPE